MAWDKAACNLTLDNPHADGIISKWGIAKNWAAAEPKSHLGAFTPDLNSNVGWRYGGQFEYIAPLLGIAPRGHCNMTSMDADDWIATSGVWRETPITGTFPVSFLHFYDGRPGLVAAGEYGICTSKADYGVNLGVYLRRYPAHPKDVDPPLLVITLVGDGSGASYAIALPELSLGSTFWQTLTGSLADKLSTPVLLGRPAGSSEWSIIDRCDGHLQPGNVAEHGRNYRETRVGIEYTDGWLLVTFAGEHAQWAYRGDWQDADDNTVAFEPTAGPVEITVVGHTAAFSLADLAYSTDATLRPAEAAHLVTDTTIFPLPSTSTFLIQSHEPAGTLITVAQEEPIADSGISQPALQFTGPGDDRAVFYNLHEVRQPTIAAGTSLPVSSLTSDTLRVRSISGSINDTWRNARLSAEVEARAGSTLADLQPNGKVTAAVALIESGVAPTWYSQFTGYLIPAEHERYSISRTRAEVQAGDGIQVRLRNKHMVWYSAFEGWAVDVAWRYVLNCCGIPDSLISVDAGVSAVAMGDNYYLPLSQHQGIRNLQFKPDDLVVSALDVICDTRDLEWGITEAGMYFLRPRLEHVADYYDWTLDDDTLTAEDMVTQFRSARSIDDYVNIVQVIAGQGWGSVRKTLLDLPSIQTSTAENFIGDDWWRVETMPDGDDPVQLANLLWKQRHSMARTIVWRDHHHPELMPDDYVRVQATSVDLPNNTIFRITAKDWSLDAHSNTFEQTLTGVIVQEGA